MKRRDDWMVRLNEVLDDYSGGVDPETINCGEFTSDVIKAMTDEDLMARFRGMTLDEQMAALNAEGFAGPEEYADSLLETHPHAFAMVGDIALFNTGNVPAFGVIIGDYAKVIAPDGSPGLIPVARAKKVYKL